MGLSMKRIRQLDEIHARESEEYNRLGINYGYPNPLFFQNRDINLVDFEVMSQKWDVPPQEIRLFTELQILLYSASGGSEDAPTPYDAARMLEIPADELEQFYDYFLNYVAGISESMLFAVEDADGTPPENWEPGELEETHFAKIAKSREGVS